MVIYCAPPLCQHSCVFNYSLISSHHVERMWILFQTGGRLFVYSCCPLSSCGMRRVALRGFVFWRQEAAGQTEAYSALSVYVSLSRCKHTYRHISYHTSPDSNSSQGRLLSPSLPSWGILCEQKESRPVSVWDVVPRRIPYHGFTQHNEGPTMLLSSPPSSTAFSLSLSPPLSLSLFPLSLHLSLSLSLLSSLSLSSLSLLSLSSLSLSLSLIHTNTRLKTIPPGV